MKTLEITYVDDDYDVTITVSQADVRMGIRRFVLHSQEVTRVKENKDTTNSVERLWEEYVRVGQYPECVSATIQVKDNNPEKKSFELPKSSDEFIALPEPLVNMWLDAVARLNPHWFPRVKGEDDERGKENGPSGKGGLTSDSSLGSAKRRESQKRSGKRTKSGI